MRLGVEGIGRVVVEGLIDQLPYISISVCAWSLLAKAAEAKYFDQGTPLKKSIGQACHQKTD